MPVPEYDVFLGRQSFQSNGSPCMQLVCADADLGAQAILKAIRKTAGCVDHHGTRVNLAKKTPRLAEVLRDDNIGMLRAMSRDMINGTIEIVYDTYRQYRGKVFRIPVIW